jgi:hypothetical protein
MTTATSTLTARARRLGGWCGRADEGRDVTPARGLRELCRLLAAGRRAPGGLERPCC